VSDPLRPWLLLPLISGMSTVPLGLAMAQEVTRHDLEAMVGSSWYAVLVAGQRVGYAHLSSVLEETPDGPQIASTEHSVIRLRMHNLSIGVTSTQVTRYDEHLKPVSWHVEQDEMGRPKQVEARLRAPGELEVVTRSGGEETTSTVRVADDFEGEARAFLAVMRGELRVGQSLSFHTFVPHLGVVDRITMTATARQTVQLGDREVEALVVQTDFGELGLTGVMTIAPDGTLVRMEMPGLLNGSGLQWVTEEEAFAEIAPMELEDNIPLGRSLGNARQLARVRLRATSFVRDPTDLIMETPTQHLRSVDQETALVEVWADRDEGLAGHPIDFRTPEFAADLVPSINAQSDDPALIAQAREIIGEERDAWEATKLLVRWVYNRLGKVDSEPRPISAKEVLAEMKGDCSEHSTLLTALCRAVGLPCRFVTGVAHVEQGYYYHAWNQVYVGRWVAVDATWGETLVDAGHLALAAGSLDEKSFVKLSLATGHVMGALKLEPLSVQYSDGRVVDFSLPGAEGSAE